MSHRDFLIKSYGIVEQIYLSMKRNGVLRTSDEKRYAHYCQPNYQFKKESIQKPKYTNFMNEISQYNLKPKNVNIIYIFYKINELSSILFRQL